MDVKKRLLVVDDEQEITIVLRSGLSKQGYEVRVAAEGQAALDLFHASSDHCAFSAGGGGD